MATKHYVRVLASWVLLGAIAAAGLGTPLVAAEPATLPAEVMVVPATRSLADLQAQIHAHVSQPRFDSALWGVKVASLATGRILFEHQPARLMSPASNSKLYTGALALDQFGGDYRIITPILATARPDADGRIAGDVVISGRGDPSWKALTREGDFWLTFEPFIAALKRAGVRHITGDIIADTTFFRGPPYGSGWATDDLNDDYGAEISAITLEDNYIDLRLTPGAESGQPCALEVLHPGTGFIIHNRILTGARSSPRSAQAWRNPVDRAVYLFGELPAGGTPEVLDVTVPQPADWFAAVLREALGRAGIVVAGNARSVAWPSPSPAAGAAVVRLGEVASPPLRQLVQAFMKPSQNLETDLIFAHVGEAVRPSDAPAWRTSEQCAVTALRDFLRRSGLPADDVRFDEGSGLSRNNLTSANATVALLTFMAAHREAQAFHDSLPVAGVDGTIRRRMKGAPTEGNVRAKTGTLRWANALSGYLTSAAGERLVFSVMLNRSILPPGRFARDDVDSIAVMLAGFAGRSDAKE